MSPDQSAARISEDDLHRAIGRNDFVLLYQPIVSAGTARTVAVEALLRMRLPSGDLALPDDFIPVAEVTGLMSDLGEWVLRRACSDGARWPALRVAVNVSPKQVQFPGFVQMVRRILAETAFEPGRLELELTEHCPIDDVPSACAAMAALRKLGVRIVLDDFGAGYSGLIYLRRLPIDKIKIDRAFIESIETPETNILVRSIIRLGRDLGLTVTTEGVESPEHQTMLADAGSDEMQGYLFARPLPAGDIDLLFGSGGAAARMRIAGAA